MPPPADKQIVSWLASLLSAHARRGLHQPVGDELAPSFAVAIVGIRYEVAAAEPWMIEIRAGPVDADAFVVGKPIDIAEPIEPGICGVVRFIHHHADERCPGRL